MNFKPDIPNRKRFLKLLVFTSLFFLVYLFLWAAVPTWRMSRPSTFNGPSGIVLLLTLVVCTFSYIVLVVIMSYFIVMRHLQSVLDRINQACSNVMDTFKPVHIEFEPKARYRFLDVTLNVLVGSLTAKIETMEAELSRAAELLEKLPENPTQGHLDEIQSILDSLPRKAQKAQEDSAVEQPKGD